MTRSVQVSLSCPSCGTKIARFSPFSNWLRALRSPLNSSYIDNENLDYIWFNYKQGWLITIEEKTRGGKCSIAQKDTHGVIAQMLIYASGQSFSTLRGVRPIEYRGHFVICFQNTTPDDSSWIRINDEFANKADIMRLLETGRK